MICVRLLLWHHTSFSAYSVPTLDCWDLSRHPCKVLTTAYFDLASSMPELSFVNNFIKIQFLASNLHSDIFTSQ